MERQADAERLLRDEQSTSPLIIHALTIDTCKMYGSKMFKLTVAGKSMCVKLATFKNLFKLKDCVSAMYDSYITSTCIVSVKFNQFVRILQTRRIVDMRRAEIAIRSSDHYDREDLVDCELLACALPIIIENATKPLAIKPLNLTNH